MRTLSVIGPGRVGRSLAKLFYQQQVFHIGSVLARQLVSSEAACDFIGSGKAAKTLREAQQTDVWMLSVPDDEIEHQAQTLLKEAELSESTIVFHCSGAKPSTILDCLKQRGVSIASVHPVRSFADASTVVADFAGTYCGIEGDAKAVAILSDAFAKIGAQVFSLSAEHKRRYHAASVIASNYLVSLIDVAQRCYESAGIEPELAKRLAEPLASKTLENCFRLGTTAALTGPIKRGDMDIVALQLQDLQSWDVQIADLYEAMIPLTQIVARREER